MKNLKRRTLPFCIVALVLLTVLAAGCLQTMDRGLNEQSIQGEIEPIRPGPILRGRPRCQDIQRNLARGWVRLGQKRAVMRLGFHHFGIGQHQRLILGRGRRAWLVAGWLATTMSHE